MDSGVMKLSPAQQRAVEQLRAGLEYGEVFVLAGDTGAGRTTVLREVLPAGGGMIGCKEFVDTLSQGTPEAMEEAFLALMGEAIRKHTCVVLDDAQMVADVFSGYWCPRGDLFDVVLKAVLEEAERLGRKLVFGVTGRVPEPIAKRALRFAIGPFQKEDYETVCRAYLPEALADGLDYAAIHRFAPGLNANQLRNSCVGLMQGGLFDTARFLDYLREHHMKSNVDLQEVQAVHWSELKGMDELIRQLEIKIALPFENVALAAEFGLKPKRGVLLAGPPGTGKTTIGRALAHRLKSKFLMIDGTMMADSDDFLCEMERVFEAAKRNAPAVIFIDDADVIFEGGERQGFYRYLLTMLDGMESKSAGRVCVMMTAMDVKSLPAALLRSGRVELWLETELPDQAARAEILRDWLKGVPDPIGGAEVRAIAAATAGFTGADLKAVVEDAKLLYAYSLVMGQARDAASCFEEAIARVQSNRKSYEGAKVGFTV